MPSKTTLSHCYVYVPLCSGGTATALVEVVKKWFELLMGALNHSMLVGDNGTSGMLYVIMCQLGISSLRLDLLF